MDMSQYKDLFVSEVREHLQGMNEAIVAMEGAPDNRERIDYLFRMAHSIKGMSASMGYGGMAELAHKMEDLMDRVRKGAIGFASGVADLLLEGSDLLSAMLGDVDAGGDGRRDIDDLVNRLAGYVPPPEQATRPDAGEAARPEGEAPPPEKPGQLSARDRPDTQNVRVKTEVLDTLVNITGELLTHKNRMVSMAGELGSPALDEAISDLSRLVRELQDEVLKVRLMPFGSVADRLPRTVRDLARNSGKEVVFRVSGKEIELDRGILEELSDPLLHLLRNAVDHGLESPERRVAAGKSPAGTITLEVRREKDRALVTVSDDGRGMDPRRIAGAAVEKGLIASSEAAALTPQEALLLICIPGFSTAATVTEVSGRGVGMDAVRTAVQAIGGDLAIQSTPGSGSSFTLSLPLTISIIQVLLAVCGPMVVAVPVTKVVRTVDLRRDAIISRGKRKLFQLGDEEIPLMSLHRFLGIRLHPIKGPSVPAVVVEMRGHTIGLVVDRFLGQQDVFVKPLGRPLNRMRGISGAAVLGDGQVIFILDPANLV